MSEEGKPNPYIKVTTKEQWDRLFDEMCFIPRPKRVEQFNGLWKFVDNNKNLFQGPFYRITEQETQEDASRSTSLLT